MKRVFINGYGSIGSRLAAFLLDDPEVEITGIGKHTPDQKVQDALSKGLDVYVPESAVGRFEGYGTSGTIKQALAKSDIVIDASPGGRGHANKMQLYKPAGIPAIYQGGESITGPGAVSDMIFNSRTNYDDAIHAKHVMQGSCNVTGMGRILMPLLVRYGGAIKRIDVTLIRRWADIEQTDKHIPDTIEMTQAPHHGQDVIAALKRASSKSQQQQLSPAADASESHGAAAPYSDINSTESSSPPTLNVRAIKVPTRQMHLHIMDVRFGGDTGTPDTSEIHAVLGSEPGIAILHAARGTAEIRECAKKMGFSFVDTNMIHIHANMSSVSGDTVQMMYSDDQTGIVIPENHMLLQAMADGRPYADASAHTESVFHMADKKRILQEEFAGT